MDIILVGLYLIAFTKTTVLLCEQVWRLSDGGISYSAVLVRGRHFFTREKGGYDGLGERGKI